MKIEVLRKVEVEIEFIRVVLPVRYDDEDMPSDAPMRLGKIWEATIDLDTGKILDWKAGQTLDFYMKVTDMGSYYLLAPDKTVVAAIEQSYVPSCVPGEYGDYVDFNINESGVIANWSGSSLDFSAFFDQDAD